MTNIFRSSCRSVIERVGSAYQVVERISESEVIGITVVGEKAREKNLVPRGLN